MQLYHLLMTMILQRYRNKQYLETTELIITNDYSSWVIDTFVMHKDRRYCKSVLHYNVHLALQKKNQQHQ